MNFEKPLEENAAVDYKRLKVDSPAFEENEIIPKKYTCDGQNINPPLNIENIPPEAKSLAIIVDDPDAPNGSFCHWVVWNIPVTHHIVEIESRGKAGRNDYGRHQYNGPCPPSGTHRYNFMVYALDTTLDVPGSSDKKQIQKLISNHIVALGIITGKYKLQE